MNELATANLLKDMASITVPLLVAGAVLKHAFPKFPNRLIPLLTLVAGTTAYVATHGGTTMNDWVMAFLLSASATGIHSGVKNLSEKNSTNP